MSEVYKNSYITALSLAALPGVVTIIFIILSSSLPPWQREMKLPLSLMAFIGALLTGGILLFGPPAIRQQANNTVISETQYTITAASVAEDGGQLDLTIEDANGKTTTITTGISDFEIAEKGDFFIVTEYETHTKSYTIVYEEESEYADVFDAFRMRQEIMK